MARLPLSLLDLAPQWVCPAMDVTIHAVGSYPAFSPLPKVLFGRYFFCDTLRLEWLSPIQAHCFQWIVALKSPDFPLGAYSPERRHPLGICLIE